MENKTIKTLPNKRCPKCGFVGHNYNCEYCNDSRFKKEQPQNHTPSVSVPNKTKGESVLAGKGDTNSSFEDGEEE